ncbi:MAG: VCBS repeat-containing protein [Planctomycetes bacterium]|nr:VCBS repeat-containing protein [Planctomycetota bacterium]
MGTPVRLLAAFGLALVSSACGSGYAVIFGNRGGSSPPPTPAAEPQLELDAGAAPLYYPRGTLQTVRLRNYELPAGAFRLAVELRAFEGTAVDRVVAPNIYAPDNRTLVFLYAADNIRKAALARWGPDALQTRDVPAELLVLVDGVDVAKPLSLTLLHQPTASLLDDPQIELVSPSGTEAVTAELESALIRLPASGDPGTKSYTDELVELNALQVKVLFGAQIGLEPEIKATIVDARPTPGRTDSLQVRFLVPRTLEPAQAHFVVDSAPSGRSNIVSKVFCRPEPAGVSPSSGSSDGGTQVVLFGNALVPTLGDGKPDLDRLTLLVRKGGRHTIVPIDKVQSGSNREQLFFSMPPSPDGRAGPAEISIGVKLGAVLYPQSVLYIEAAEPAAAVFVYGDSYPTFGPRGGQLREAPVLIRVAPFLDPTTSTVDALSLVSGPQGIPVVTLMASRGNGMLSRFGESLLAGSVTDAAQRNPVDMCIADFSGDGSQGAVIINRGTNLTARHSLVLGSASTNPPLALIQDLPLVESGVGCAAGQLNGDSVADLAVLADPGLQLPPSLYLSAGGRFERSIVNEIPAPVAFESMAMSDVDADGRLDLIYAQGGLNPRVLIAFGEGDGSFPSAGFVEPVFDLKAAGYTPHEAARVVSVHAAGLRDEKILVLVIGGVPGSVMSPPAVVFLERGSQRRSFKPLTADNVLRFPGGRSVFVDSAVGDLIGDGTLQVAVAALDDDVEPVRLFVHDSGKLRQVRDAVVLGGERFRAVRNVAIGTAVAGGVNRQKYDRPALFVTHESDVGGGTEYRISTLLSAVNSPTLRLLSPDGARRLPGAISGVALGAFATPQPAQAAPALDGWLVVPGGLQRIDNDGLGEFSATRGMVSVPGILGGTLTRVTAEGLLDLPVFLTADGRLGTVSPTEPSQVTWLGDPPLDLRSFAPLEHLKNRPVQEAASSIHCADIDGDGTPDMLAVVSLALGPDVGLEGETLLLFLRGRSPASNAAFPFDPPVALSSRSLTHGNTTSVVVGNLATGGAPDSLELAVAVPSSNIAAEGNHVRFYRFDAARAIFVPTFVNFDNRYLAVGSEPMLLAAGDYNSDGRTDLAVVSRRDRQLWVMHNFSRPSTSNIAEVDVGAFQGAPSNPTAFSGAPVSMLGGDLNGDRVPDLLLVTSRQEAGVRRDQVLFLTSPGRIGGLGLRTVPSERTGELLRDGSSWTPRNSSLRLALGDLNADGTPDLVIGWATSGEDDFNLRVLFGNSF